MQYGDIDYMTRQKDFTYDPANFKGLPEFVQSIKKDGLRYIIILVSVSVKRIILLWLFNMNDGSWWNTANSDYTKQQQTNKVRG